MIILLYVFLGVMAVAVATTVFAIVRARDGFEDESGFHLADSMAAHQVLGRATTTGRIPASAAARVVTATPVGPAAPGLPVGLVGAR